MPAERRNPAVCSDSNNTRGKGEMIKAPISLQDLRRSPYVKAKAEPSWRFWGLYVHVCRMETLRVAYQMARRNGGAPGIDGVTFEPLKKAELRVFSRRFGMNWSLTRIGPCRHERRRYQRMGAGKSASFGFLHSVIEWSRAERDTRDVTAAQ
jgi:hypothetical protein